MGEKNAMRVEIEQALHQFAPAQRDAVEISGREHFLMEETPVSIEENGEHSLFPGRLQSRQEVTLQARVVDIDHIPLGPFAPSCIYQLAGGNQSCGYFAAVTQGVPQGSDIGLDDLRDRAEAPYQRIGGLGGIVRIAQKREEEILQDR